jgi:hypothetical protein
MYVAVWKGGRFAAGKHKGERAYTFVAMGRTRAEARAQACRERNIETIAALKYQFREAGDPKRRRQALAWRRSRIAKIVVVRYAAALTLVGVEPDAIAKYYARLLDVDRRKPMPVPRAPYLCDAGCNAPLYSPGTCGACGLLAKGIR